MIVCSKELSNNMFGTRAGETKLRPNYTSIGPVGHSQGILGRRKKEYRFNYKSERNKNIIDLYYHHPDLTLTDIGQKFGISRRTIYEIVRTYEFHELGPLVSNGVRIRKFGRKGQPRKIEVIQTSSIRGIFGRKIKRNQVNHIESERNKTIIDLYCHHPDLTLTEIGKIYGITQQRVSLIVRHHNLHMGKSHSRVGHSP